MSSQMIAHLYLRGAGETNLRGGAARETHTIRYFDGFLGARIGPVSALCFHPSKTMLAVGATDSVLSLFGTPSR